MVQKNHYVVVLGYGCHINSPLRPYLDRVYGFLMHPKTRILGVVLCGGATQKKTAPGKTEARVMFDYLTGMDINEDFPHDFYTLEEDSYTTCDNIKNATSWIYKMTEPNEKVQITIFCEAQRALKAIILSRRFMVDLVESVDDIKIETYNWERADPVRELKTTFLIWLDGKIGWLRIAERERHRRIRRSIEI